MCGVIGHASSLHPLLYSWLDQGLQLLDHRGPDSQSVWTSDCKKVHLGHTRLSILDPSNSSNQPFRLNDSRFVCVYNGEIYNFPELKYQLLSLGYTFNTTSDTEVLLRAFSVFGSSILGSLNGMFSFCIYDQNTNRLYLARDRSGQKPLYYSFINNSLLFASEIKSLLLHPEISKRTNPTAVYEYFTSGFIGSPNTLYQDILSLAPGNLLTFDLASNQLTISSFLPPITPSSSIDLQPCRLQNLLYNSVKRHLCSDVPLGLLLSGGIDSSLIAALAANINPDINCFTVSFPNSKQYDELSSASLVANHLGLNLTVIKADNPTPNDFFSICSHFDQPLADSSILPSFLLFREVSNYCKVAIGGDGGDELFGGYKRYIDLMKLYNLTSPCPKFLLALIEYISINMLPPGFSGRSLLSKLNSIKNLTHNVGYQTYFHSSEIGNFLPKESFCIPSFQPLSSLSINDFLDAIMINDYHSYLPFDIMVKSDITSMYNSLEVRAPFLDTNVINYAQSISSSHKLTSTRSKLPLRKLSYELLPNSISKLPKQGFLPPLKQWLRSSCFLNHFKEVIYSCPYLTNSSIDRQFRNFEFGIDNSSTLFHLYMFSCSYLKHGFVL